MNVKKLIASVTAVAIVATQAMTSLTVVNAATVNPEWTNAVNFMKTEGLSSVANSVEEYMPLNKVTREQAAKFFSDFAEKEFGMTADTTKACNFADINEANSVFVPYIKKACQLGILKGANGKAMPKANLTKLQFLTILARIVKKDPSIEPVQAFALLKADGITKEASLAATNRPVSRIELAILFQRAVAKYATTDNNGGDDDLASAIDSILGGGDDNTTDTDNNTTDDNTTTGDDNTTTGTDTPATTTENKLTVAVDPATPAGTDVAKGADSVLVSVLDLTAGSQDVSITEFNFERTGFGEDAAKQLVLFVNGARATKAKTANSDDEFNVTVAPALVVKAGETVKVEVRVVTDETKTGEFAIKLSEIKTTDGTVEGLPLVSNTFDVKDQDATILEYNTGSVNSQVNIGEKQADIAEFDLKNQGNVNNSDITVYSITLREVGSVDQEDELSNYALYQNGTKIADGVLVDKYITFKLNNPVVIKDGKKETFKVKADIEGGANKTIKLVLDTDADIVASATKYFGVNVVNNFAGTPVTIQAGEVTLYSIDAENDKVRDDTDDVLLGTLKVVNVAGKDLSLKNFGVKVTTSAALNTVLENVKAEVNGVSYDLTCDANNVCSETDLDVALPQGDTYIKVVADTLDNVADGTTIELSLDASDDSQLRIEETEDDTKVEDIVPSSLTWDDIEIKQPKATLSKVSLADIAVVKGAENVVALQYEVEANEVSDLSIDKVNVKVNVTSGDVAQTDRKNYVSQLTLYKGSVSDANKLDSVAGTKIGSDGTVTFDGFEISVAKDQTETFIVTVSILDSDNVAGKKVAVEYVSSDIEDDQNDTVTTEGTVGTGRTITIKDTGTFVADLTGSVANSENEYSKVVLAGNSADVFSVNVSSLNESLEVDEFNVTLTGTTEKDFIKEVKVTLDGKTVVANNSDVTVSGDTLVVNFDNLSNFIIPTTSKKLIVTVVTEPMGYEKIGKAVEGVKVYSITANKDDVKGTESNEKLADDINIEAATIAKEFDVVPAIVTPAVTDKFGTDDLNASVKLSVDAGNNTDSNNNPLVATLSGIKLSVSSITASGTITLFNGNGDKIGSADVAAGDEEVTITVTDGDVISQDETYRLETTAQASFRLAKDGVIYTVDGDTYTTKLQDTEDLGQYTKSN